MPSDSLSLLLNQDNIKLRSSPSFSSLQYQDAGNYVCETALQEVEGLKKRESLTLIVEGKYISHQYKFFFEKKKVCFMSMVQHYILIVMIL